jgi:cytochrome c oxidase subunit 3
MPESAPPDIFMNRERRAETAQLGIWVFLSTEILFFGPAIILYLAYHFAYPAGVGEAAKHTNLLIGGTNTGILLLSSFFVAWAVQLMKARDFRLAGNLYFVAAGLGIVFLILKATEYVLDYRDELIPAVHFSSSLAAMTGASLFFIFYFIVTLLHALHVTIGIVALTFIAHAVKTAPMTPRKENAFTVGGLYWHFVDAIWVLLFALIYLPGRSG